MADLALSSSLLRRIAARNNFDLPEDGLVFFGVRGATPLDVTGTPFAQEHAARLSGVDHLHMRCTLGQMRMSDGALAVFPGSTVPSRPNIVRARAAGGEGANMLVLGFYEYEKGEHKSGKPSGHRAFRQGKFFPVWRTADDLDYDAEDRVDLGKPGGSLFWDNLHSAYHDNVGTPGFSSAGCQVVCGHPKSPARQGRPETGPWKRFIETAYTSPQQRFVYLLCSATEIALLTNAEPHRVSQTLRFGSTGPLVEELQTALSAKGFAVKKDGDFGRSTLEALLSFQALELGRTNADGVVGANTAAALGLRLPSLADIDPPAGPSSVPARPSLDTVETAAGAAAPSVTVEARGPDWYGRRNGHDFYVGRAVRWGRYAGLYQPGASLGQVPGGQYDPAEWSQHLGPWAWFLLPTIMAESGGHFGRINTYDGAGLTFGPLQYASHTPEDNLVLVFRRLAARPDARSWFPDLGLAAGRLVRLTPTGDRPLETVAQNGRLQAFMEYLNPNPQAQGPEEALNCARLIAWQAEVSDIKRIQLELAVTLFKRRVARLGTKYGVPLQAQPIYRLIWVADVLHHGRGTYARMRDACMGPSPDSALAAIGAENADWKERLDTVERQIQDLQQAGRLAGMQWGSGPFG